MDQETIRKIAEELAHYSSYSWTFWVTQGVITLVAAGAGAFFGEYLKTRGKNLATKADFEGLQKQLRAQTELVETVRSEVSQRDWTAREWTNVRRVKLEELLNKVLECEEYRGRYMKARFDDVDFSDLENPEAELRTLQTLYFPELELESSSYLVHFHEMMTASTKLATALSEAGTDESVQDAVYASFAAKHAKHFDEILKARSAIEAAARNLMEQIMGVRHQ